MIINKLIILFCLVELIYLRQTGKNIQQDYELCTNYTKNIIYLITQQKYSEALSQFSSFLNSGITWNDMGDPWSCNNNKNYTYARLNLNANGLTLFQGLCFYKHCNADVLNAYYQEIFPIYNNISISLNQTFHVNLPMLQQNTVTFTPYGDQHPSTNNAAFIVAAFVLCLCLALSLLGPFSDFMQKMGNKQNKEINEELIGENQQEKKIQKKESILWKIVNCWNLKINLQKMFTLKSNNDDLLIFNGIRTISFLQVVLGHEFYLHASYMANTQDFFIIQKQAFLLFISGCLFSVDTFFWLGGFFVAYVAAEPKALLHLQLKKPLNALRSLIFAILHRIFRILPCYLIAIFIYWKIADYFGESPTWDIFQTTTAQCDNYWYLKLLFIDNLFDQGQSCFGWGWYLSNDFQMFIFSMILLMFYSTHKTFGKTMIFVSLASFQALGIYLSFKWDFEVPITLQALGQPHQFIDYYVKPWCRCPPYFLGLYLGILYREYSNDKNNNTLVYTLTKIQRIMMKYQYIKWVFYSFGLFIILGIIYGPRPLQVYGYDYWPQAFQNFWFGACRLVYCFGLTLFVIPALCGSKDLLVRILSNNFFAFIARLSFCGYLIHFIILSYSLWGFQDSVYLNVENMLQLFVTEAFLTIIASIILSLIIEIPIINLSAQLLKRQPQQVKKQIETPAGQNISGNFKIQTDIKVVE